MSQMGVPPTPAVIHVEASGGQSWTPASPSNPLDVEIQNSSPIDVAVTSIPAGPTVTTAANPAAVSVGTSGNQLVASSATRRYLLIQNNGSADLYIAPGNSVTVANAIKLVSGASYELLAESGMAGFEWTGRTSSGTADTRIVTGVA